MSDSKKLTKQIVLEYKWWRTNKTDIIPAHASALETCAVNHICCAVPQGRVVGALHNTLCLEDTDPDGGVEYSGWWTMEEM